jgi:predicted TIM-barrel fold metal-dependent hydrolase
MSSRVSDQEIAVTAPLIIDTDTHFTEEPELWTSRLPAAWGDQVMQVRWSPEHEAEVWTVGDEVIGGAWSMLAYGTGHIANSQDARPKTRADIHPASWIQAERVKVMDDCGIRAAVLYPNFGGLKPSRFMNMASAEVALAHVTAYNDGQLEWARNYPGRFIPMLVTPFWDLPAALAEIERTAGQGFGGIVTTAAPHAHGQPFLADPHWDPLWQACVDAQLSVSFHIGSGNTGGDLRSPVREKLMAPATHLGYSAVPHMVENGKQMLDLLLSGVLVRHPELKFVSVESGMGWVPFVLEAADYHFLRARRELDSHPWGDLLPSDLFHRQCYVNAWFEHVKPHHLESVGADNVLFETDFPHRTCLEQEDVEEVVARLRADLDGEVVDKILWGNALTLYGPALEMLGSG